MKKKKEEEYILIIYFILFLLFTELPASLPKDLLKIIRTILKKIGKDFYRMIRLKIIEFFI